MKFVLKIKKRTRKLTLGLVHTGTLLVVLILSHEASITKCAAKEFDWSDLGVSLANAKPSLGSSGSSASNLRILVSPQRRMTKNYEFDYTNGSQALSSSGQAGDASSYVVSSSSSPYLGQSVYQLSPNHSSAYSALSASLATLKNRLSARGMTLSSASLGDSGAPSTSHLYTTSNGGSYGSTVLLDPSQQAQSSQQQAQQQQVQAQQQGQQSQPTYLSVPSSQQDSQSLGAYTLPPSQGSESNKTIVLAIPAKINFLTGASSKHASSQQQAQQQQLQQQQQQQQQQQISSQQQAQHLSLLQPSGVLNGQEAGVEQAPGQQTVVSEPQEQQHQYVIVNQQAASSSGDHHSHSVAAGALSPSSVGGAPGQVYSTAIYQPASGSYAIKQYIPTYTQAALAQPASVQKVYSVIEPAQPQQQQQQQHQQAVQQQVQSALPQSIQGAPQQQVASQYETQLVDPASSAGSYAGSGRYASSCIDTCNSSDPRWRKYTVSKYKACCSRSAQFDPAFEQPSAERVGFESLSSRYAAEEAYYNYLNYRRSRARRARRQRQNPRYTTNGNYAPRYTSSASQASEEEPLSLDSPASSSQSENGGSNSGGSGGSISAIASAKSTYASRNPYYYRSRSHASQSLSSSSSSDLPANESPLSGGRTGADELPAGGAGNKYYASKQERYSSGGSYRRARGRDLSDASLESSSGLAGAGGQSDVIESDEAVYPPAASGRNSGGAHGGALSSYGNGEYSVDMQARGYGSAASGGDIEDDEPTRYDETSELEPIAKGGSEASDYQSGSGGSDVSSPSESSDDGESESQVATYRQYSSGAGERSVGGKRKKLGKLRRRQQAKEQKSTSYYKKSKKSSLKSKYGASESHSLNGTDYESAQPGDNHNNYQSESQSNSSNGEQQQQQQQQHQEDAQATYPGKQDQAAASGSYEQSGSGQTESEKDAILAKYRASLNDTTVANLSKTTMHLKEILSILEKKAAQQIGAAANRYNDSLLYNSQPTPASQPQQASQSQHPTAQPQQPVTSTPAPITTSWREPLSLSSLLNSSPYSSSLSSDFLTSDFSSLKSPYRFDPTSFSAGSLGASSLSLPSSSPFASFSPDSLSLSPPPPPPPYPSQYAFHQATKHLVGNQGGLSGQKKRRPSKSSRYNELMLQKAAHGLVTPSSLLNAKNRLLNPAYYSTLNYPYLYRGNSPSITSPYPYKNHHKNPYSSLLSGSVSSKLAAAAAASGSAGSGGLYTEESRLQGISNLDPLSQMSSSLRSPSAVRLRSKPFIFQPQVLPIYTRHTILTSPLDVKA